MFRITVLYGHPTDPAEFERYYYQVHLPLAAKMKGIRGFTVGKCESSNPAEKPAYYRVATLFVENREAFQTVFGSPEGQATVADLSNFATGGVTMLLDDVEVLVPLNLEPTREVSAL